MNASTIIKHVLLQFPAIGESLKGGVYLRGEIGDFSRNTAKDAFDGLSVLPCAYIVTESNRPTLNLELNKTFKDLVAIYLYERLGGTNINDVYSLIQENFSNPTNIYPAPDSTVKTIHFNFVGGIPDGYEPILKSKLALLRYEVVWSYE